MDAHLRGNAMRGMRTLFAVARERSLLRSGRVCHRKELSELEPRTGLVSPTRLAPAAGLGIPHEPDPSEVDLGELVSPHETTLVDATLESAFLADLIQRMIGDKAYDSNVLDECLWEQRGSESIALDLSIRRVTTQDGRALLRDRS